MMAKNEIVYRGNIYTKIRSGNCYLATSLLSDSLEVNTLTFTLESEDAGLLKFKRHDPIIYRHAGKQVGVFYVDSIKRIAKNQYDFKSVSALGLLLDEKHLGGIYTGQEAQTLIDEICGPVAHVVKSGLRKIKIYGWLPIDSPRNNLARVLFAIGATVKTDLDGVIHIDGLWDGISGMQDRICLDSKVDYKSQYSSVAVTEHQYIKDDTASEESIFEGQAGAESKIYTQDPYHSYRGEGITIKKAGANYAIISGNGKLYAKPYRHSERLVSRVIDPAIEARTKEITDATLVTLVNSVAVVTRMEAFYRCTQTIEAPAYYAGEKPGDRVTVSHPYDAGAVDAVVQSMSVNISNELKSNERLLVGYIPPQIDETEYFDFEEIITEDSTWTVPDGVKNITAVLIGGGSGGYAGGKGEDTPAMVPMTETDCVTDSCTIYKGFFKNEQLGKFAKGGEAGEPGESGKIHVVTQAVEPGQTMVIKIGHGGVGQPYGSEAAPSSGTETTLDGFTSASGASSDTGYHDEISGNTFAGKGKRGVNGGHGSYQVVGSGKTPPVIDADPIVVDGVVYTAGESRPEVLTKRKGDWQSPGGSTRVEVAGGCGGGPAYGGHGKAPTGNYAPNSTTTVYAARPGDGGDAIPPKPETIPGKGGTSGNGGGGAGAFMGPAYARCTYAKTISPSNLFAYFNNTAIGGKGSDGGNGADGCVIIIYRKPKEIHSGAFRDKNGKFLLDRLKRQIVV